MQKIVSHPILDIPSQDLVKFYFKGNEIYGQRGFTIAAALHQAGYPVHGHSLDARSRSLECGIGKCGACEMLVDGRIKRICCTLVDDVKEVKEILMQELTSPDFNKERGETKVYHTKVLIVGAGPAGLAVREDLNKKGIPNLLVDANDKIGGQFLMQTHAFFFFEKEKKFGGMRGFDIARTLAGDDMDGILLNSVVWDILEGKKVAIKDKRKEEIFYIIPDILVVATGAIPFMPAFENDDLPGVYTAAVLQKMMNNELTLLGKKILTVGAGNIGYLTSYQAIQAGASVKAIVEAMPKEGGFPVQANRIRRLAVPIYLSHILLKAIPNANRTGISGAVVAECENFKPIPGTEKRIDDIDVINICTGLQPDNELYLKGKHVFGDACYGAGDAMRIGEGTSAVLRGKQCAAEIMQILGLSIPYDAYLDITKQYVDSQQHPIRLCEEVFFPDEKRAKEKSFVILDCLYGFACNPCAFACKYGAIQKSSTSEVPRIDYEKCIGCMDCIHQCPGLAIFGYNIEKKQVFLPFEYDTQEDANVFLVNNQGRKIGKGKIEKIFRKPNKTHIARVLVSDMESLELLSVRGFIEERKYPQPLVFEKGDSSEKGKTYICHCDDVQWDEVLHQIGNRKFISIDEIKHTTHLAMGPCRGKRCVPRLRLLLRAKGIELTGDPTPRAPLSNQILMQDLLPTSRSNFIFPKSCQEFQAEVFIAGGGMGGSSLFRYMAEAGMKPVMANAGRGSSWRNIAGGRPAFSMPEISDIARHNLEIFKELDKIESIDLLPTRYISFAHDESSYKALDASMAWSNAKMIDKKDFAEEISPYINSNLSAYQNALISYDCWQSTPGKVLNLLRKIGMEKGGTLLENTGVLEVQKTSSGYHVWVLRHTGEYAKYKVKYFVNALGENAHQFALKLGIQTGVYPVKHQAFITRRLPMLGVNGQSLDMLIDRRKIGDFSAVYGQQLAATGQIILCASPLTDSVESNKDLIANTQGYLELASNMLCEWIPSLGNAGLQAAWSGYYVEPRYIVDPSLGLFIGLRGHGFMLSQYLAKLYVQKMQGQEVPSYFEDLRIDGSGLAEMAFK